MPTAQTLFNTSLAFSLQHRHIEFCQAESIQKIALSIIVLNDLSRTHQVTGRTEYLWLKHQTKIFRSEINQRNCYRLFNIEQQRKQAIPSGQYNAAIQQIIRQNTTETIDKDNGKKDKR